MPSSADRRATVLLGRIAGFTHLDKARVLHGRDATNLPPSSEHLSEPRPRLRMSPGGTSSSAAPPRGPRRRSTPSSSAWPDAADRAPPGAAASDSVRRGARGLGGPWAVYSASRMSRSAHSRRGHRVIHGVVGPHHRRARNDGDPCLPHHDEALTWRTARGDAMGDPAGGARHDAWRPQGEFLARFMGTQNFCLARGRGFGTVRVGRQCCGREAPGPSVRGDPPESTLLRRRRPDDSLGEPVRATLATVRPRPALLLAPVPHGVLTPQAFHALAVWWG